MKDINPEHQKQVCDWVRSIGLDPMKIPLSNDMLTVTPINEGELRVSYCEYKRDRSGKKIITRRNGRPVILGPHHITTDSAPPGFNRFIRVMHSWDAYVFLRMKQW